jgi:4-amino-4-deoxy-L-arabinose transferase-like glycosyltransferase
VTDARADPPEWPERYARPLGLLATALIWVAVLRTLILFLMATLPAIGDPAEYDYGEGIVWQQMRMMFAGKGYVPIDSFPSIVFHYPPVYHAVTWAVARLGGFDEVAAGRGVSLAATFVIALLLGLITTQLIQGSSRLARLICGLAAGAVVLSFPPVVLWARVMRVDMVACALSLGGFYLAMLALRRPRLIHLAALAFVAGVYAKQTMIAAPASVFLVLLALRPRLAIAGIATSVTAGLIVLATLTLETSGGFPKHIFLYNINRIDLSQIAAAVKVVTVEAPYLVLAFCGFLYVANALVRTSRGAQGWADLRARLDGDPLSIQRLMVIVYLVLTTLMLAMIAKIGASVNYLIEWMLVIGMLVGLSAQAAAEAAFPPSAGRPNLAMIVLLPVAFAVQAMMTPGIEVPGPPHSVRRAGELAALSSRIRTADRPVISDNMVLLIRSGKPVVWEPAIFAELAHTDFYDERPFVKKVRNGDFAFFLTDGERGSNLFDSRYSAAVADAMDSAYPKKQALAGLVVHLPANAPLIR